MDFDLWGLFVEQIFGGFWISVFGIGLIIFVIMAVFGRMSKLSVIFYEMLFLMTMTVGWGYKWLTALLGMGIMAWAYFSFRNWQYG